MVEKQQGGSDKSARDSLVAMGFGPVEVGEELMFGADQGEFDAIDAIRQMVLETTDYPETFYSSTS